MAKKPMSGLRLRYGRWHIDKRSKYFPGGRLRQSTSFREEEQEKAEELLIHKLEEARKAVEFGVRPDRPFEQAATKYLIDNQHKASIDDDGTHLNQMMSHIGSLPISKVHNGTLEPIVKGRLAKGIRPKSINNALGVVRRILNLAAGSWHDENGLTWLGAVPKITMLPIQGDKAKPYPLSWQEQRTLLMKLPDHLAEMSLYKVNTGAREQEVCQLSWDWEVEVPELNTLVFLIPGWLDDGEGLVKNREDRLHVLNKIAISVIKKARKQRPAKHLKRCCIHTGGKCNCAFTYVFTYKGYRVGKMNNTGWKRAWREAKLPVSRNVLRGVHNLKHTFGRRLRSAGVSNETRRVLLGHTNGDITTDYSAAEVAELLEAVNRLCLTKDQRGAHETPTLTLIKRKVG